MLVRIVANQTVITKGGIACATALPRVLVCSATVFCRTPLLRRLRKSIYIFIAEISDAHIRGRPVVEARSRPVGGATEDVGIIAETVAIDVVTSPPLQEPPDRILCFVSLLWLSL